MKKILFIAASAALMVSCAPRSGAVVNSTITEAKTLQELAKARNLAIPESAEALITAADKQNDERQTSQAFVLADEAILQLQFSMLKQEHEALAAENKKAADGLASSKESLEVYRNLLQSHKNTPKEQVTH